MIATMIVLSAGTRRLRRNKHGCGEVFERKKTDVSFFRRHFLPRMPSLQGAWYISVLAISGPILIIPLFYIFKTAHLYNTHMAIILSECLITIPFGVLMMKNFFDGLPMELMESANVDGASIQRCFFNIYLPLAKPAIINLAVLQIMWSFQDFLFPLMFLTKDSAYTTTVAVNAFKGAYGMTPQNLGRYNAALVLISIPSILDICICTEIYCERNYFWRCKRVIKEGLAI